MGDGQPNRKDVQQGGGQHGKMVLAEWETKDSKLAVKYCRGCHSRRNAQSHRRVCWKVGVEHSKLAAFFNL